MYLVLLIGPIVIAWKYIHFRVERAKVFKMGFEAGALYAGMAAKTFTDHQGNLRGTFVPFEVNREVWRER